ncbi:hypothetical protein C1T31_12015 [Hanstruepera neustonica]|uniref:Uncharacterized protein n=1 Tax=Hanstruepera neustonica TaxID=1445657 RepID=A0A2K1DWV0_9FLAO|nr:hypothetical protein C1T31_12015 [Hanstruepera neustonica]
MLIISCDSKKSTPDLADKEFEVCIELEYSNRIEIGPAGGNLTVKKNIHKLLEQALVKKGYLTDTTKNGYLNLFNQIKQSDIDSDFFDQFKIQLGFDPFPLFPFIGQAQLKCYDQVVLRKEMVYKTSWQYNVMESLWEIEKSGDLNFNDDNLANALMSIPEDKFELLIYRKLFLDVIYIYHNFNK